MDPEEADDVDRVATMVKLDDCSEVGEPEGDGSN